MTRDKTGESDEAVSRVTARYPTPDITPGEFEVFATTLFDSAKEHVLGLVVEMHEKIRGVDGTYDFDATVRYQLAGMEFLVLVEAKRHTNPIKRGLVQELESKKRSVGAHKAVMISTAPYQSGAVAFALVHRIALVTVTEGRFIYETKSSDAAPAPSRAQAVERYGIPTFVGHAYSPTRDNNGIAVTLMSPEYPEYVAEQLLGVQIRSGDGRDERDPGSAS